MSLLCNIIKAEDVRVVGRRVVKISDSTPEPSMEVEEVEEINIDFSEEFAQKEAEIQEKMEQAQQQYEEIINNAHLEAQQIIETSKEEASIVEKKAYEEGHAQGLKNGYEDGYKEVYEENIEKAKQEADEIIKNANSILFESNNQIANYIKENKSEILNLSISIAEQVLKDKFEDESAMDNLISKVIDEYQLKENFIIKAHPTYKESLDKQILQLKENHKLGGDVFVIADESLELGNAVIDNPKGSLIVGIDGVLDKIKEELL